jgi:putative nucleotidyltransferase with HDIG domain
MNQIDVVLDTMEDLPPAAEVMPQLLRELERDDMDLSRAVDLIAFDPALTAKLLQTCNSAFYFRGARVSDAAEAVQRLGFHAVYTIVAVASAGQLLQPSLSREGIDPSALWRHSVTTAFASQFVAEDLRLDTSILFTAGLLHDLGKVILAQAFKGDYARLIGESKKSGTALVDLERAEYGVDHAEAGALAMERWSFPPDLIAAVRFHHDPAGAAELKRFAGSVNLADMLAHALDGETSDKQPLAERAADTLVLLRLTPKNLDHCAERVNENVEFVQAMCRL